MIIRTALSQSYRNLAEHICKVNGWECQIVPRNAVFIGKPDMYIGSQYDVGFDRTYILMNMPKVLYITVEGDYLYQYTWNYLREICNRAHCIVPTKWGKGVFESHNVRVADVIYHALPDGWQNVKHPPGPYDVVYLNNVYTFLDNAMGNPVVECERKGWRWWELICSRFSCIGFAPHCNILNRFTVGYNVPNVSMVYHLLSLGKVYTSLTTHEGFGINNIMALALGLKQVAWDIPVLRETIGDIHGVYMVPAPIKRNCYMDIRYGLEPGIMEFYYGDINEYISVVEKALGDNTPVDRDAVLNRFNPDRLYRKFAEFFR